MLLTHAVALAEARTYIAALADPAVTADALSPTSEPSSTSTRSTATTSPVSTRPA